MRGVREIAGYFGLFGYCNGNIVNARVLIYIPLPRFVLNFYKSSKLTKRAASWCGFFENVLFGLKKWNQTVFYT